VIAKKRSYATDALTLVARLGECVRQLRKELRALREEIALLRQENEALSRMVVDAKKGRAA